MTEAQLREKVVKNVTMLKGVEEGSAEHKMIIDTFNKSKLCKRYKMTTHDSWCATTVSYAFIVAGMAGKPGSGKLCEFVECSCGEMIALGKKQGVFEEKDSYIPTTGDVIFYDWDDSGKGDNTGWPDHVGLVVKVNDGDITVIEGNKSDSVAERHIKVNAKYIRGFIAPKYSKYATTETAPKKTEYYPKASAGGWSFVDALKSVGVKDPTMALRKKIAAANGIANYKGSAIHNLKMLNLLKKGKLKKA